MSLYDQCQELLFKYSILLVFCHLYASKAGIADSNAVIQYMKNTHMHKKMTALHYLNINPA